MASAGVSTSLTGILMATWRRYMGQGGGGGDRHRHDLNCSHLETVVRLKL